MLTSPVQTSLVVFKQLTSETEYRQHFKGRHDVWLLEGGRKEANEDGIDVDAFDEYAVHLGAFAWVDRRWTTVGGIRVVFPDRPTAAAAMVRRILSTCRSKELTTLERSRCLPSLQVPEYDFKDFLRLRQLQETKIVEFSRTFCVREWRQHHVGLKLAFGILAYGHLAGAAYGIGACALRTLPFYRKIGCEVLDHLGTSIYGTVESCALGVPLQPLPAECQPEAGPIIRSLFRYGAYCGCSAPSDGDSACDCIIRYQRLAEQPDLADSLHSVKGRE